MNAARAAVPVFGILLCACAEAPLPIEPSEMPPAMAAVATGTNSVVPYVLQQFVPCANGGAGEIVALAGELHLRTHTTTDARGGVHGTIHANPQGVQGVGLSSGAIYRGTGMTRTSFSTVAGEVFSYVNVFRVVGRGRAADFSIQDVIHVTINANLVTTSVVAHSTIACD